MSMVRTRLTNDGHCGRVLLTPNFSCSYQANLAIICGIGVICLIVGIGFGLVGAWLVLPFIALEFFVLVFVLRFYLRRLRYSQLLVFGPNTVVVARQHSRMAIHRERVKIVVEAPLRYTDWPRLLMVGGGHTIELGAFLSEDDNRSLQQVLCHKIGLRTVRLAECQLQEF